MYFSTIEKRIERIEERLVPPNRVYVLLPGDPVPDDPNGEVISIAFVHCHDGKPYFPSKEEVYDTFGGQKGADSIKGGLTIF